MANTVEKPLIYYLRNHYVLKEKVDAHITYRCFGQQGYIWRVTYSRPFNDEWTDRELTEAIIKLNCQGILVSNYPLFQIFPIAENFPVASIN